MRNFVKIAKRQSRNEYTEARSKDNKRKRDRSHKRINWSA